jgi:bifunctional non-homologous end joining protein LigD
MLAEPSPPFSHPDWLFEVKWDGWRALAYGDADSLRVLSRQGRALSFPELADLRARMDARSFVLDGELVSLDENGLPDFQRLQKRGAVTYYAFDLLHLDGFDLQAVPLETRKRLLATVLRADSVIRISDHIVGQGEQLFAMIEERGLEGVMAKHAHSAYEQRRHPAWRKIKCTQTVDCVVVGMTRGERSCFGALVLAMFDGQRLVHVGNVGSGFNERTLREVHRELEGLTCAECAMPTVPKLDDPVVWLRPQRVAEVKFAEWTVDGILRFPVFLRLRDDKSPRECVRGALTAEVPEPGEVDGALLPASTPRDVTVLVDGVRLQLTNLDKVFFPADGITKRDLINYYHAVSGVLLPHLHDRPLNLKRYPDGITGPFFFQKHGERFPDWIQRTTYEDGEEGLLCNDLPTLVYLSNLACIDHNPLQSRITTPHAPDWMLLDLDPQGCGFDKIVEVACLLRALLEKLELRGYPKTTGGRGMHIYVPLGPGATFEQSTMLAQLLARVVATRRPDLVTLARVVARREQDRVYIDYPQGGRGRSISAPYSVRPRAGATVATPLLWEEVRAGLHPQQFTLRTAPARFDRLGDVFAPVLRGGQDLAEAIARIDRLLE